MAEHNSIIHPRLVEGLGIQGLRIQFVGLLTVAPAFSCIVFSLLPLSLGTFGARLIYGLLDVFGLVVLVGGMVYLVWQSRIQVRLTDNLVIDPWGWGTQSIVTLSPQALSTYSTVAISPRQKKWLRYAIVLGATLLSLGWLLGWFVSVMGVYGTNFGTPSARVDELVMLWIWLFVEVSIVCLAGLLVVPFGWRLLTSDGWIILRGRVASHSRAMSLRIFAQAQDLDAVQSWLVEHGVEYQDT